MKKSKRRLSVFLIICLLCSLFTQTVLADDHVDAETIIAVATEGSSKEIVSCVSDNVNNVYVIDSLNALEQLIEQDRLAFQKKVDSVDPELFAALSEYIAQNDMVKVNLQKFTEVDKNTIKKDFPFTAFLGEFPEYRIISSAELQRSAGLALTSSYANQIRQAFSDAGYILSLALFDHSLIDNPADVLLDLNAANDDLRTYVKGLLNNEFHLQKTMVDDIWDYVVNPDPIQGPPLGHIFTSGDLHFSINRTDLIVEHKVQNVSASFTIDDYYDYLSFLEYGFNLIGVNMTYYDVQIKGTIVYGSVN